MIASFSEEPFPLGLAFGTSGGPERRIDVVRLSTGHETRNQRHRHAFRRYDAGSGVRSLADLAAVLAFFEARRGKLVGFRFRDPLDHRSSAYGQPVSALGFTDHDEPIAFEGVVFEASSGLSAGASETELGLASGTREVDGALSSLAIEEKDILAGRYDGASVETFLVNWQAPDQRLTMDSADLGEVKRSGAAFSAELRGIAGRLDRRRGRLYRRRCDAHLGDRRCGVDMAQPDLAAAVAVAGLEADGAVSVSGAADIDPALFQNGRIVWTSGEAGGLSADIASLRVAEGGALRLSLLGGPPAGLAAGDAARLEAGCDKTFATCRARFANGLNFRGFPHLPGSDAALSFAKKDGGHDGSPVVP